MVRRFHPIRKRLANLLFRCCVARGGIRVRPRNREKQCGTNESC